MKMNLQNNGEPKENMNHEYISLNLQIMEDDEYKTRIEELILKKKNIGLLYLCLLTFSLVSSFLYILFFPTTYM